jgi:hypothetical protein
MNRPDSTAKNVPKIAELKLSSCGLEVADFRKNCDCGIAEKHFFKSCGIAIAEVLPSSCGIAIADSKKVARAHHCWSVHFWHRPQVDFIVKNFFDEFSCFVNMQKRYSITFGIITK